MFLVLKIKCNISFSRTINMDSENQPNQCHPRSKLIGTLITLIVMIKYDMFCWNNPLLIFQFDLAEKYDYSCFPINYALTASIMTSSPSNNSTASPSASPALDDILFANTSLQM